MLHSCLRRKGRKYRKRGLKKDTRGLIKNRVLIDDRPLIVADRVRFGDMEIDLVIGKNHKQALLTMNDLTTGKVWIAKLKSKNAKELAEILIKTLRPYKRFLHTITSDNGKEFAMHELIAKELDIEFYFCQPYHSWERGANENLNGLIRQYLPKKTSFENVTAQRVRWIEKRLNNQPRKRLGYLTPNE